MQKKSNVVVTDCTPRQPERRSSQSESEESEDESSGSEEGTDSSDEFGDSARTTTRSQPVPVAKYRSTIRGPATGQASVGSPPNYTARPLTTTAALSSSPGLSASPGHRRTVVPPTTHTANPATKVARSAAPGNTTSAKPKSSAQPYAQTGSKSSAKRSELVTKTDNTTGVESWVAIGDSSDLTAPELRQQGVLAHKAIERSKMRTGAPRGSSTRTQMQALRLRTQLTSSKAMRFLVTGGGISAQAPHVKALHLLIANANLRCRSSKSAGQSQSVAVPLQS